MKSRPILPEKQRSRQATDGSISDHFRDVCDKPVQEPWHAMKFWWPHDEALIATLMAHKLTGESR